MLVVVAVVGVLSAIAVPVFDTVRENAAERSVLTMATAIANNANAIAAADGSGGEATPSDIILAVAEIAGASAGGSLTDDLARIRSAAAEGSFVQISSGSYDVCAEVTIVDGRAVVATPVEGEAMTDPAGCHDPSQMAYVGPVVAPAVIGGRGGYATIGPAEDGLIFSIG